MKLKVFNWLEQSVHERLVGRRRRMNCAPYPTSPEEASRLRMQHKVAVDYRISIGARVVVPDDGVSIRLGRDRVIQLLAREMFADLTDELQDLREWAFQEGIGDDLDEKLARLISLTRGDEVP